MARLDEAVSCPACGARNKGKWEFCARCGESLQGAESVVPAKKAAPARERAQGAPAGGSSGNNLLFGIAFAALVGTVVYAVRYMRESGPAPAPAPAALTVPTQPGKPTPPPAPTSGPGAAAFQQGFKLLREGNAADATGLLAQAVSDAPDNALYQRTYGEALVRSGSQDAGLAALAEASRLDPLLYRRDYAKFLDVAGRSTEAAAEFEAMIAETPDDAEALAGAGRIAAAQKNYAKALPLLRRAVEQRPNDTDLMGSLAKATEASGDANAAALAFGEIVLRSPANHIARSHLAAMLVKQGRIDQALRTLQEGIAQAPSAPELRRALGSTLEDAQRPAEAAAAYRAYARLAPGAADAKDLLDRAERLAPGSTSGT
ncbi:MAG TPA: tetratricopeptide repeat protein [Vicinamibacteria bacterium]|nr:tetratricopeptide repeat protein [Vicinamibacteria bacterium]